MSKGEMQKKVEELGYDNLAPGFGVQSTNKGFSLWLNDELDSQEIHQNLKSMGWDVSDNKAHPLTWSEK